ncbi:MAG: glucokinase [Gammaproteobacteria bacterium]|jgi:glucokinase|uniref:Glucokinase n=1 Tax=Marinomonas polaris DSM 16579 TaxID=1122206 RepID=A0A1M5F5R3_9GAMM|nr:MULTISPECIES: glucokinase [Marinomonas]MBU2022229.1 glucokinase [Gammaproteobacteria bacterium]MBU2237398.1 glucokinase [Gammaproteobacteria bacterium]MBU2317556.1 glucokinase [Gammaproteobacteria bacterium]MBU2414523.1 glucokinase [Gammaproteobacteria bacterium]SHF86950.1 glucokinase [Marinomonas polaris DSM 16579]|tara:strand:+ start:130310 stop:131284 length:975 start_codon:yes stop_codon:yes gene_type:complete
MSHALIADLGGTNARFALVPIHQYEPLEVRVLPCENYDNFFDAAADYIENCSIGMDKIDAIVLAIAGPVNQPVIQFSNNPWKFTRDEVQSYFGDNKAVALLNDFDAVGHCLEILKPEDMVVIGESSTVDPKGACWVVGAGTGLGISCVVPQDNGPNIVLPGEGGHVDLSACNDVEDDILKFLRTRHKRVSAERVLSGMGLENIYEALALREGVEKRLTAPEIGEALKLGNDPIAIATLEQFFVFLGRVIGDLVLSVESRGGVYIAGGIVPRYLKDILKSGFRDAMQDKGRMKEFVSPIPTFVVMSEYPGLMGCACYASHLVSKA